MAELLIAAIMRKPSSCVPHLQPRWLMSSGGSGTEVRTLVRAQVPGTPPGVSSRWQQRSSTLRNTSKEEEEEEARLLLRCLGLTGSVHRLSIELIDRLIKDGRKFACGAGKVSGRFEHRDELRRTSSGKPEAVQPSCISVKPVKRVYSSC